MAQVAEIAQQRIAAAREETRRRRPEEDESSLMQASMKAKVVEDGISTFGLELQFLTDELSAMTEEKARVRSALLRGLLARRYGCGSGRLAMGARAMALEAAAVAFDDSSSAVESEVPECADDRAWGEKWWRKLLGPIMEEERQLRVEREKARGSAVPETVQETQEEDLLPQEDGHRSVDIMVQDELEVKRQVEQERAAQAKEAAVLARQLQEYEQEKAREEQEDMARFEELQAQYAQEWDDWVVWSSMNAPGSPRERHVKRQKMVLSVQVQGELQPVRRLDFDMVPGVPVTIGLHLQLMDDEVAETADNGGDKAASSQSPTERVSPLTPEPHSQLEQVKGSGLISDADLTAFMASEEGLSVFRAWSTGGYTSDQIRRLYGEHVLEACLANHLVVETGSASVPASEG